MKINYLNQKPSIDENVKLKETYLQFENILTELRKIELPDRLVISINQDIEDLNSISNSGDELRKIVRKKQTKIIKSLEDELKLLPKNYYRNLWIALGTAAFGIPIGVAFGASLGNMAYIGIGLPLGLAIGIAVGKAMDKKALEEGRQIDLEINC